MDPTALASQISSLDSSYNPTDTYNKITTQLGIPDARTRVQALQSNLVNTQNAIKAVDPSVTARTSSALVTEAQRGRLVNMERAPLTDTANSENQDLNTASGDLTNLLGQATTQAGLAESAYKDKRTSLADQLTTALQQQAAAEAKAQSDRAFAESQREFNVSASQKASSAASKASADAPSYQQRSADKGFNFQDNNGKSISARTYAALTGTNFTSLLQQMAAKGDSGAADYLKNGSKSKAAQALAWG